MSDSSLGVALAAVLGSIGAEAGSQLWLEALVWPQRYYANLSMQAFPMLIIFMPMGGPLHKVALKALDIIFAHGLFKGSKLGHMLGTIFFKQLDWQYTMHAVSGDVPDHIDTLRNCIWAQVLSRICLPNETAQAESLQLDGEVEKGASVPEDQRIIRARTTVSHLTLSAPSSKDLCDKSIPFVQEGTKTPAVHVFLAMLIAESSAVMVAIALFAAYRSASVLVWFAPLLLRLLSALFALERESLIETSSSAVDGGLMQDFVIQCPQAQGSFMVVTSPPALMLQFVRHYGHPVRNRFRENFQIAVVVCFAFQFPLSLLVSALWMPQEVQQAWLCYQLYIILAMYTVRFSDISYTTSTTEALASLLSRPTQDHASHSARNVDHESAILFGHERNGKGTIKASVAVTRHNYYRDGKTAVSDLLHYLKVARVE